MLGNSWVAAQLPASQEGLSSMELVSYVEHADGSLDSVLPLNMVASCLAQLYALNKVRIFRVTEGAY
jgi:hypothetical protein